jgi:hypothetical protein
MFVRLFVCVCICLTVSTPLGTYHIVILYGDVNVVLPLGHSFCQAFVRVRH